MKKILVVDDELGVIESLKAIFYQRYDVYTATCVDEVFQVLEQNRIELLILDIILPKDDGLEILSQLRLRYPDTPVIMLSAVSSTSTIAEAIRLGAVEFITKPFDVHDVRIIADKAIQSANERRHVEASRREAIETGFLHQMPGESVVYRNFLHQTRQVAATDEAAVLLGERGTGKDTIARLVHTLSARADLPFIRCQHSPGNENTFVREFFGDKQAQNGANSDLAQLGKLDLAGSGTIYVDELHLLPEAAQSRLGDLLESGTFTREGGEIDVKTNCRLLFSVTTTPEHELWQIGTGPEMQEYFQQAFPRIDFSVAVTDDEWEQFAASDGIWFPKSQLCSGMYMASPCKRSGIVLLGDAIHEIEPNMGEGLNAALEDVAVLDDALQAHCPTKALEDEDTEGDTGDTANLGIALAEFQKRRGPDVRTKHLL